MGIVKKLFGREDSDTEQEIMTDGKRSEERRVGKECRL